MSRRLTTCEHVQGTWGTSESEAYAEQRRNDVFGPTSKLVRQIDAIASNFRSQLAVLLEMIRDRAAGYVPSEQQVPRAALTLVSLVSHVQWLARSAVPHLAVRLQRVLPQQVAGVGHGHRRMRD